MKPRIAISLTLIALALIGCGDKSTATRSVPADQVNKKSGVAVGNPNAPQSAQEKIAKATGAIPASTPGGN